MPVDPDLYFELTTEELREVTRFALAPAEEAVALLDAPTDRRILAAIDAAQRFAAGEPRSKLQRVAALDALREAPQVLRRSYTGCGSRMRAA